MKLDKNRYSKKIESDLLHHSVFETSSLLINKNSGFDIKYQINKVHNLNLAAKTLDKLIIKPQETFSFWQLVRHAERFEPYKAGLNVVDGKTVSTKGGGLCQLSNMLFWMFLHTPLTIVERRGHAVESFPSTTGDLPCGTDATVHEGWLDLKVKNETDTTFQIAVSFDDEYMHGRIYADSPHEYSYKIFNSSVAYFSVGKKVFEEAYVDCLKTNTTTQQKEQINLYRNVCQIGYKIPNDIEVKEREINNEK